MPKPPVVREYGCFPFLCDRLKKIFPFLRDSGKAQKMERHRGKLSPTIHTKSSSQSQYNNNDAINNTRKVSETRKISTVSSGGRKISTAASDGYHRKRIQSIDHVRKISNSSNPPSPMSVGRNRSSTSTSSNPPSPGARNRSTSQGDVVASSSRKTSTAYAKKLNDAIDQDDGCQPKYIATTSAIPASRSPLEAKNTKTPESKELNDIVSMATINEQQSSDISKNKSKINRLRWKRGLSVVKK